MTNQDLHCRNFTTKRSEPVYSNNGKLMIDVGELGLNTTDTITHDKLDLINLDTSNINSKLENFISQTLTTKLDNTLILNTAPGVASYADSIPAPVKDSFKRDGWFYTNTLAGNKFNYYYYANTGYTETLGNIKGQFSIFQNDSLTTDNVNVILTIYGIDGFTTGPKRVYYSNQRILPGVKYLVYWGVEPNIYPELPRIEYNLVDETNWDNSSNVLTMSVGSDTGSAVGIVQNLMTNIGYIDVNNQPVTTTLISSLDSVNSETQMVELLNVSNSELVSVKNNTSDIAINTLGISNDTQSINGKITSGDNNTLSSAQQVLLYGKTSGGGGGNNLHSVLVTGSGHLVCDVDNFPNGQETMALSIPVVIASDQNDINVKQNSVVNLGSYNNINNNSNISPGELSTLTSNISNMRECTIVYTDISPDNFDSLGVEVSGDGVNFHEVRTIFPFVQPGESSRSGFVSFNVSGFVLVRIRNKSAVYVNSNVNCSVYGSP